MNLLRNGGFEADWGEEASHRVKVFPRDGEPYETEIGEFHTPPGWLSWFYHAPGTYDQPELGDIRKEHVSYRVCEGKKALRLFTFYRRHDAGVMQQVEVRPGQQLRLTAKAHAWSNHPIDGHEACADDPRCSAGVGMAEVCLLADEVPEFNGDSWNDAVGNFGFRVGIDPTGGTDPFADTVIWGPVAYIYNAYHAVPEAQAEAVGDTVTVFLRSKTLWSFKHNDAYWDDVCLVGETPEPPSNFSVVKRGAKVGVHGIHASDIVHWAGQQAEAGAPFAIIKAAADLGWIADAREASPRSIILGRLVWGGEGCQGVEQWDDAEMEAQAERAIGLIAGKVATQPELTDVYWEPVNEPDPPGPDGYRALARYMIALMDGAERRGFKLALFSLNAGTPEWDEMEAMVSTDVFTRAREGEHILALHEGTFTSHDPKQYWGGRIPGAPAVEGAGALNCRYRYLYHLLKQRGEVVPLVISEWYCGDEQSASTEAIVTAMQWYDEQLAHDYYAWGFTPFTLGPSSQWKHTDYKRFYPPLMEGYMMDVKDRLNALAPSAACLCPREPYLRSYILLPQIEDRYDAMLWRMCAAAATADSLETVGHSADDAGVGPAERYVVAVNPDEWGSDLEAFFKEHYAPPELHYSAVEPQTPYECGVMLLPHLTGPVAVGQNDARWSDWDFGEHAPGGTVREFGCFLVGATMVFRRLGYAAEPPLVDLLFRLTQMIYVKDNIAGWQYLPELFPSLFDATIRDNRRRTASELRQMLAENWHVILPKSDYSHYVLLEAVTDGALRIIDTFDGEEKVVPVSWAGGVRAVRGRKNNTPSVHMLAGLHDEAGGEYLAKEGL